MSGGITMMPLVCAPAPAPVLPAAGATPRPVSTRPVSVRPVSVRPAPARTAPADSSGRAVIATDPTGQIRHLSPAAQDLLGYSWAELVGRSLRGLHLTEELAARSTQLGIDGTDELEALFAPVRGGALPHERQRWTYVRGDAARVRATATVTPVFDGDQEVMAFVVLLEAPRSLMVA